MIERRTVTGGAIAALLLVAVLLPSPVAARQDHPGKASYDKWCAGCHGVDGQGEGPGAAYMLPRPRNFVQALYQVRTTRSGSLPTDADILHVIDVGMPGTAMPGWQTQLNRQERDNLVAYIKTFSRFFETDTPDVLELTSAPRRSDELIEMGRESYQLLECWKCHGTTGRGDGQSAPTQEDNNQFPIRPANLTQPWLFNAGATVEDIYRTLRTGLDGTPMPSLEDALQGGVVTDEQLWGMAYYVMSLAPDQPVVREVIEARLAEDGLPASPGDSAWNAIDRFWVPLSGQIIVPPRWFSPAVTGIWVQAAYDDSEIAFRLSWDDRSRSPDPVWADWRARVTEVMAPHEGDTAVPAAGPVADDSATTAAPASPDAIAMWFPRSLPSGMDRPYFFMGDARVPVYMWHWNSQGEGEEMLGRGPGRIDPLPGEGNGLVSDAVFDNGQWSVTFRRPRVPADSANAIGFVAGAPIPVAFFAWDGDNGEHGTRGALSTWFFVYLTEPTSAALFATPLFATLLTAGLGLFVVGRAQRRDRARNDGDT